jgi:adenine-specific DNA-methyltransferase
MPRPTKSSTVSRSVEALRHDEATRRNIPTAEYQSVVQKETESPLRVAYERRNRDLDPQLGWRGKDAQDWSDLVVNAPPLYIQAKVHPKVLIDDLLRAPEQVKCSSPADDWCLARRQTGL